jgi:AcrR family transcriptional regulator
MVKRARRVKRPYSSDLRRDQARATASALVETAFALFSSQGYAAVSIDAIAKAAGVGRATVFASVGGKPALLKAAYGLAFARAAGGEPGVPLVERPRSQVVHTQKTAHGYLVAYAELATDIMKHLAQINEAVREAAPGDAAVKELLDSAYAERRRGADRILAETAKRAVLRPGLDNAAAADAIWILNDPSVYYALVFRRNWPPERYRDWLIRALEAELLP